MMIFLLRMFCLTPILLRLLVSPLTGQTLSVLSYQLPPNQKQHQQPPRRPIMSTSPADEYLHPFHLELSISDPVPSSSSSSSPLSFTRGVKTLVDRTPGEPLLQVPLEDTILASTVLHHLDLNLDLEEEDDSTTTANTEEEILALGLLWLRNGDNNDNDNSNHLSYVQHVLPKEHHAVWTLPQNLWDQTVAPALPRCYRETFQATRDYVTNFAHHYASSSTDRSVDDLLWAFSMVRSRSVAVPELQPLVNTNKRQVTESPPPPSPPPPLALIPGLDLLNHAFGAGTQLSLEKNSGEQSVWALTSSEAYKAGDELFLSYGDDKDNWKLLLTYGFAERENPNSIVFWTWQDLLEAANRVRPGTFTERTCQSLLRHPQLQAYTILSENRATFSLDAKAGQPRESLSNGLMMLSNLATQLGYPNDEELAADVLGDLQKQRLQDLSAGQSHLRDQLLNLQNSDDDVLASEWRPFLVAVQTALQQEATDLASSSIAQ